MKRFLALLVCGAALTTAAFAADKTTREVVTAKDAPKPPATISQAIKAGGFVFAAGQIAIDPATGKLAEGDIKVQTERVLKNLETVLQAGGSSLDRAVKVSVYLKDMSDFSAMNEVYAKFFPNAPPARTTVQAAGLALGARIEIDVIAAQ